MIHPRMRRCSPSCHRRAAAPGNAPTPPPRCPGAHLGPSVRDGDTTPRHGVRGSRPAARRSPRRARPLDDTPLGRRSRPSPGTSPVSRRRRRGCLGADTCQVSGAPRRGRPGCGPAVISSRSEGRLHAGTRTVAGSPARPQRYARGTCRPEAAGRPPTSGRPGGTRPPSDPSSSGTRSPATSLYTGPGRAGTIDKAPPARRWRRRGAHPPRSRAR